MIADALNGIAYRDDAQVAALTVRKALDNGEPRMVVIVTGLKTEARGEAETPHGSLPRSHPSPHPQRDEASACDKEQDA